MILVERIKSGYKELVKNPVKLDRIFIVSLLCILLLVICVVLILNNNRIDTNDDLARLLGFRTTILAGVAIVGLIFIVLTICKVKLEWLFLAVALGIGLLYMFAMTPFSVPDEHVHYINTTHLTSRLVGPTNTTFSRESDFDYSELVAHYNAPNAYLRLLDEGIRSVESEHSASTQVSYITYPIMFLPQAIGITLGRLLQLNFFGLFYLGRLFNLLLFVTCGVAAIRAVKDFKLPIFIICILPMTIHQAASLSPDSFINGVAILFLAYLIRLTYEKDEWSLKDIAILALTGILLSPSKNVYFIIVLLIFFAAPYRFGWKNAKGYLLAAGVIASCVAVILLFNLAGIQRTLTPGDIERWHGGTNYTTAFIFENPVEFIKIILRTVQMFYEWYFFSLFGMELAGLTLVLPKWYIIVFMVVFVISVLYGEKDSWVPKWLHKVIFLKICGLVVLVSMIGMFLSWTPDTHPFILGVQGRYFIPLLPLFALIFRSKLKINRAIFPYALIAVTIFMHFMILRFVLDYTIAKF